MTGVLSKSCRCWSCEWCVREFLSDPFVGSGCGVRLTVLSKAFRCCCWRCEVTFCQNHFVGVDGNVWQTYDFKSHFIYPYATSFQNLNLKHLEITYVLIRLQEALHRTFHNLISKLKLSNIKSLRQCMDLMQPQEATYMPPMKWFLQTFIHTPPSAEMFLAESDSCSNTTCPPTKIFWQKFIHIPPLPTNNSENTLTEGQSRIIHTNE